MTMGMLEDDMTEMHRQKNSKPTRRQYGGKMQDYLNQLGAARHSTTCRPASLTEGSLFKSARRIAKAKDKWTLDECNAIFIRKHEFHSGKTVYWRNKRDVYKGTVVCALDTESPPAVVRSNALDYQPSIYAYCDERGDKPVIVGYTEQRVYRHPDDFRIGQTVYWMREQCVMAGTVTRVFDDVYHPVRVGCGGRGYKPSIYKFCDKNGDKPTLVPLPAKVVLDFETCSKAALKLPARSAGVPTEPDVMAAASLYGRGFVGGDRFTGHDLGELPPGVLIQGSVMGPNEYASDNRPKPWQFVAADCCVREHKSGDGDWGIYLRRWNVRLATFAFGSSSLRRALTQMFDAAHALKVSAIARFKEKHGGSKLPKRRRKKK